MFGAEDLTPEIVVDKVDVDEIATELGEVVDSVEVKPYIPPQQTETQATDESAADGG